MVDVFAENRFNWTPGDGSAADRYGERLFTFQLLDVDETNADAIALKLVTNYSIEKRRWRLITIYIPTLSTFDRVTFNYAGARDPVNAMVWGINKWGDPNHPWGTTTGSIRIQNIEAKILMQSVDLNAFVCEFLLEEI